MASTNHARPAARLHELLAKAAADLSAAGIAEDRLEARLLMALAARCTQVELLRGDLALDEEVVRRFHELVAARIRRVPYAYLAGRQEFYGLEFKVTRDVLVPRPETEALVEAAVGALRGRVNPRMADVGTGSGCIAVACAVHVPSVKVVALDLSPAAARVARANVLRHQVEHRVAVVCGDLLAAVSNGCLDLVASNPPYVASEEVLNLQPEVSQYEPRIALDGGSTGMEYHERLLMEARRVLKPDGWLMVETAAGQAGKVADLFRANGYHEVQVHRDASGMDRVVCGTTG